MKSIWEGTPLPSFDPLHTDTQTEVLIIGGGMAGILTAHMLGEAGVPYVLAERDTICSGNTGRTTAKITVQHGFIYSKIQKYYGTESAQKYYAVQKQALEEYAKLCKTIPCDFEICDNYIYSHSKSAIAKEMHALSQIGVQAVYKSRLQLPFEIAGAIGFADQAQFHPLKFVSTIARGLNIYEHTPVLEMIGNTAVTPGGRITAKKVICTTHFPMVNKHGLYPLKLYQHRSYVIAFQNVPGRNVMYAGDQSTDLSLRSYGNTLILGGGGGRTGKPCSHWDMLREFAREHYPEATEVRAWAAQDCMSLDSIPYIGQYGKATPDFYAATGFNKWGMTNSMVSALLLRDAVLGRKNEYAEVFDPNRSILKKQLFVNSLESAVNLLTPTAPRCPHLGCALKWNSAEHSWDCPCHGSRFAENGKLLDNPATGDLPAKKTD